MNVRSDVRMKGVFLQEGEHVEVVDPETGLSKMDQLEDERQFEHHRARGEGHRARLEPEDPRGAEEVRRGARGAVRPLPEDADLRRQRPAAHLARRPVGQSCPRRLRPGRRLRPEDHRAGGPPATAHPGVPQPPQPRHRRDGGPAHDRRGHPRPRVHRLPAAGEDPHPVRADARARHPEGREVPRQDPLHRLRLLRRHAARLLQEGDRHHRRSRR